MTDPATIARGLTDAQRRLVTESEPGGWGSESTACGTEVSGAKYRTAAALKAKGLGDYSHGSPYGDLYFNSDLGLAVRTHLLGEQK